MGPGGGAATARRSGQCQWVSGSLAISAVPEPSRRWVVLCVMRDRHVRIRDRDTASLGAGLSQALPASPARFQ